MGTLGEKLSYLKETKEGIKAALSKVPKAVSEDDTFRSYAEKISQIADVKNKYILGVVLGWPNKAFAAEADADGFYEDARGHKYWLSAGGIVMPSVKMTELVDNTITYGQDYANVWGRIWNMSYLPNWTNPESYPVMDLSRLDTDYQNGPTIETTGHGYVSFISLPEKCSLIYGRSLLSQAARLDLNPHVLYYGLSLGRVLINSNANMIATDLYSLGDRPVYVMKDFENSLFLSRISMSVETMVNIFNNLKDFTGITGTYTRTIDIGANNLAKLTEEQLNIVYAKGWNIT